MKKYLMKAVAVLALGTTVTACHQTDDYFNPNYKADQYASSFERIIGTANPDQDWNLFVKRNVSFYIGGDAGSDYTVALCAGNPVTDKNARQLYKDTAKGGTTFSTEISVGYALQDMYALLTAPNGQQTVKSLTLDGNTFSGAQATQQAKSMKRSSAVVSGDPFTFESTESYYKTSVPEGAVDGAVVAAQDWNHQYTTPIKLENDTYALHFWQGKRDIYVSGNVTLNVSNSGSDKSINQAVFYVLPGATLTLNMSSYINDLEIYVSEGATLNYNSNTIYTTNVWENGANRTVGGKLYNKGTLNVPEGFGINQGAIVYNEGTMNAVSLLSKPGDGNPSFLYNFGDMYVQKDFELASNSNFYNEGNVTIEGNSISTQQGIWWINKGHYTVYKDMTFSAGNGTFYNYCSLFVDGEIHMFDGFFNEMDNSYTQALTATFKNFCVNMGTGATFNVQSDSKWLAQGDGSYQGFKTLDGATGALVRLGGYVDVAEHRHTLQISGDITYAIKSITPEVSNGNYPIQVYGAETNGVNFDELNLTKPSESQCAATWSVGNQPVIKPLPMIYTVAFEDLGSTDDFDFNDVVIQISHDGVTNKAQVSLVGAGAQLVSTVKYGDKALFTTENHSMQTGYSIKETAEVDFTSVDDLKKFSIVVNGNDGTAVYIESATVKGKAPQALIIPNEWAWPAERVNITDAYPAFKDWVQSNSGSNWYTNPVSQKVINR
jgi:hypothetical protein